MLYLLIVLPGLLSRKLTKTAFQKSCKYPDSWEDWDDEMDCLWSDPSEQYWYHSNPGNAGGTSYWNNWNSAEMDRFEAKIDDFAMHSFWDQSSYKCCLPDGTTMSLSKITSDTVVANCNDLTIFPQKC